MPFMEWRDDYATGIADIDNDHKVLFTFVNDLHDRFEAGAGDAAISETLDGLVNYVNVHFVREEGFMERAGYPDLAEHAESHRRLSARVFSLKETFDENPEAFNAPAFLEFLRGWLSGHILYTDMDYVATVSGSAPDAA